METDFELTNEQLVAQAVPTVSTVATRLVDVESFRLAAKVQGSQVDHSSTSTGKTTATSKTGEDGAITSTSQSDETNETRSTRSRKSPDIPGLPESSSKGGNAAALEIGRLSDPSIDAFTKFRAAAALKQELVALNRSVGDYARRTGYVPYLVRLQFGIQPRLRRQPFDARLRVSFIPGGKGADGKETMPIVVPLVATDNLEATNEQRAVDQLRQALLSLSLSAGLAGGQAAYERSAEKLTESDALRPNSLYSVGREGDSTLIVRLGASRIGDEYEMVARAVQSTVLILVPKGMVQNGTLIDVVSRPSFNNAETGRPLDLQRDRKDGVYYFDDYVYRRYCDTSVVREKGACESAFHDLADVARDSGDFADFSQEWKKHAEYVGCKRTWYADHKVDIIVEDYTKRNCLLDLWADMQRQSEWLHVTSIAHFELPKGNPLTLPPQQAAVLFNDKKTIQVTLSGVDSLLRSSLSGQLKSNDLTLQANALSFSAGTVAFNFPLIKNFDPVGSRLCIWVTDYRAALSDFTSAAGNRGSNKEDIKGTPDSPACYDVIEANTEDEEQEPAPLVSINHHGSAGFWDAGKVQLTMFIGWDDAKSATKIQSVKLSPESGALVKVVPDLAIDEKSNSVTLSKPGRVQLTIQGPNSFVGIPLAAQALDSEGQPIANVVARHTFAILNSPK